MRKKEINRNIKKKYDIKKYLPNISKKDGESEIFEIKSFNSGDIHDKLIVAKEISAFANTNGGIIGLGLSFNESKGEYEFASGAKIDLQLWFDENSRDFLEPIVPGLQAKILKEADSSALLVYIPPGSSVPYRVRNYTDKKIGSKDKDIGIPRQYYQRVGTNSIRIEEPIVRYMYNSKSRVPDISFIPKLDYVCNAINSEEGISLRIFVKPDSVEVVDQYKLEIKTRIYDKTCKAIDNYIDSCFTKALKSINNNRKKDSIFPGESLEELICINMTVPSGMTTINIPEDPEDQNDFSIDRETLFIIDYIKVSISYAYRGRPLVRYQHLFVTTGNIINNYNFKIINSELDKELPENEKLGDRNIVWACPEFDIKEITPLIQGLMKED